LRELGLDEFGRLEWKDIPEQIKITQSADRVRSLEDLWHALEETPEANIVHFDGHGLVGRLCGCRAVVPAGRENCLKCGTSVKASLPLMGYLLFEGEGGYHAVSAEDLGPILSRARVRLVLLNSCQSATIPGIPVFNAVAPALFTACVRSVVGMQFTVGIENARVFSSAFYDGLVSSGSVVQAMAKARASLVKYSHWFVPVLYLRSDDQEGQFFQPVDGKGT
jgi:CHAT domain-containing protein